MAIEVPPARIPAGRPSPRTTVVVFLIGVVSVVGFALLGREPSAPAGAPTSAAAAPTAALSPTASAPVTVPAIQLQAAAPPSVSALAAGEVIWRVLRPPSEPGLGSVVATAHGLAGLQPGTSGEDPRPILRWSSDGDTWVGSRLSIPAPVGLQPVGDDLIVYGWREALRFAWHGKGWVEVDRLEIVGPDPAPAPIEGSQSGWRPIEQVVFGAHGAVMVIGGSFVLYSPDGHRFAPADVQPDRALLEQATAAQAGTTPPSEGRCDPGGGSGGTDGIGPVVATSDGFIAFTASHPGDWGRDPPCEPVVWRSSDGRRWDLVSRETPFGAGAWVQGVAARDGRIVAVGGVNATSLVDPLQGRGAIWLSDDGLTWRRGGPDVTTPPLVAAAAGDFGWVAVDDEGGGWGSADGQSWQPTAVPMLLGGGWWGMPSPLELSAWGDTIVLGGFTRDGGDTWRRSVAVGTAARRAPARPQLSPV